MLTVNEMVGPSADQFDLVFKGMRLPLKSGHLSDSRVVHVVGRQFELGEKDKRLALNLIKAGASDRKFLRQLPIVMEITAPEYWFKQLDTYKVGTCAQSTSLMHTMLKEPFSAKDFSMEKLRGYKITVDQVFPEFTEQELEDEEWVDLGNGYKVSNLGRMTGIKTDILKPVINSYGYVTQYMKGKRYHLSRIVAGAFCPKRPEANYVNHINANKLDNRACNLEWVTQKENIAHSRRNFLQSSTLKTYKGKFTEDQRAQIISEWETGNYSMRALGRKWGVSHDCISNMVNGKSKYQDLENEFEKYGMPIIDTLNELRDIYITETDPVKKKVIWDSILALIPESYNYTRCWSGNYEVLLNIIRQREGHKLGEWKTFIDYCLENVPHLKEFLDAAKA